MKHLKKSPAWPVGRFILLMLLTSIIGSRTFAQQLAQQLFNFDANAREERAKQVMQDNEYASTGYEKGIFFCNPLMLDGKPLAYSEFNILSEGELTVTKGAAITGQTTLIPFYVYLRRNGNKIFIRGKDRPDPKQIKIDISEILKCETRRSACDRGGQERRWPCKKNFKITWRRLLTDDFTNSLRAFGILCSMLSTLFHQTNNSHENP